MDEEFGPDGIQVASLRESGERGVRESHFDHTQASSFREGGNIPPIWVRSRGGDTRLIGLAWVDEYQAILALPESGIGTGRDLRGRRLALPRRVNDQIDFWRAKSLRGILSGLALEGMDERDVELVDLPVQETYLGNDAVSHTGTLWTGQRRQGLQRAEAFALIRGQVDAIYSCGALGAALAAFLGARVVVNLWRHPDRQIRINNATPTALTVSGALCRERPDLVARYVERTIAGARWAETHRAETVRVMANEVGAPEEWVEAAYHSDFNRQMMPDLSAEFIAAIESQKDFLLRWDFIEHDFDTSAWVDPLPLEEALARAGRPAGVKI
jgi:ABC-type nitrate/sulfonate/bicarbonate transport system substrate-binding protein